MDEHQQPRRRYRLADELAVAGGGATTIVVLATVDWRLPTLLLSLGAVVWGARR